MTFKHVKFEDSVTMRSLAKVAKEKGWIQEDLVKTASSEKKSDYSVTGNLTVNIVKLCSGLRAKGFDKYADELEEKFINYKKANSLYDTSKETGEDLVDAAHPDGSHKLEGVEGDSVIETIIDQQLQAIKMVNKNPTGKLSKASQVINKVKFALAQGNDAAQYLSDLAIVLKRIKAYSDSELTTGFVFSQALNIDDALNEINNYIQKPGFATTDTLRKIKESILDYQFTVKPGVGFRGIKQETWDTVVKGLFEQANSLIDKASNATLQGSFKQQTSYEKPKDAPVAAPTESVKVSNVNSQISSLLRTTHIFSIKIQTDSELPDADKVKAKAWLKEKEDKINQDKKSFESTDAADKEEIADNILSELQNVSSELASFKSTWID